MKKALLLVASFICVSFVYYRYRAQTSLGSNLLQESIIQKYPLNGILHQFNNGIIYYPIFFWRADQLGIPLLESPKKFISFFEHRLTWIDELTIVPNSSVLERSRNLYIEMLISMVNAAAFSSAEFSVSPGLRQKKLPVNPFDPNKRAIGIDWTYIGDTMVGQERLLNIWKLLSDIILNNIDGDFIETGVWRGGSSILARGILDAFDSNRKSYVCDSFRGLPPGSRQMDKADSGWDETPYLEVSDQIVASSFNRYSLMSDKVIFAKGFFNETMPQIRKLNVTFSLMRLDVSLVKAHHPLRA
jgi:O-methyltransferase